MAVQLEEEIYEDSIYEIAKTDKVLGGLGGITNLPLLQLANRTAWLKNAIDVLESGGGPFEYNASAGTLPSGGTDGPGTAGIKRKDVYFVTVAGTVSGVPLQIGDQLIAKQDDADDILEFLITQSNAELATPTVIGMVKLVQNLVAGGQSDAVLSVAGLINLFAQLAGPTFTGSVKAPNPADAENSTVISTTKWVTDRLVELATSVGNSLSSEATTRGNADATLQNNINAEAITRANADTNLGNIKANKVDATAWTDLNLGSGGFPVPGNNVPQWRINQFGEVEFRGEFSVNFTMSGSGGDTAFILGIPLPDAIRDAINANTYFIDKFLSIPLVVGVGSIILVPVPALLHLVVPGPSSTISMTIGFKNAPQPAGTYTCGVRLYGLRANLT